MISPGRLIAALSMTLLLLADIPNARASESADADDLSYALALLEASGVDTTPDQIERVLRDELETVVWVQSSFEGLPVFFHNVGYVFEPDGQPSRGPGNDAPLILGNPLPGRQSFPVDHNPDISEEKAFEAFRERLAAESSNVPEEPLEAVLGFHNLKLGSGDPAEYRLAWRVRPIGTAYPDAMVSAKKGDVLYFDSGRRSNGPVSPDTDIIVFDPDGDPPPQSPLLTGTWYSPRCDQRSYTRSLTLREDGTFLASDLVAPCPKDAQCIWSGIVGRSGTWQFDRDMIELTPVGESRPGRASPLPQLLRWEGEGKLVEVVVGGPMTCEYRRNRQQPEVVQDASDVSPCRDAIQGRIAWDYNGSTVWANQNLMRLCAGAGDTTEPGACFEEAMHGGLPGKSNTQWRWQDALALCAGTTAAQKTIGCYQAEHSSGSSFEHSIAACGT